jgi:hypothetical protein
LLFIETPICQFSPAIHRLRIRAGYNRGRAAEDEGGPAPRSGNREELRYKIATEDRHAHNSPNVVNKALTKLKIGQGLFKKDDASGAAVRHSFSEDKACAA